MTAGQELRQLPLPLATPPSLPAGPFFEAASNREALAWIERATAWPDQRLLLWGPAGVGKTHLLSRWAEARGGALLAGASLRWPAAGAAALAVDDADLAPEEPLLHLLNDAARARLPLLLTARASAAAWPIRLADLASRLRGLAAVAIAPPEDDLLRAVLRATCAARQLTVPEPVQEWLLLRLPRTPAALVEATARLDRAALAAGGRVTRPLAAAIVDEMAALWQADTS